MVQMLVETFGLSVDLKDKVNTCVFVCAYATGIHS